jgi:hypothetical protein
MGEADLRGRIFRQRRGEFGAADQSLNGGIHGFVPAGARAPAGAAPSRSGPADRGPSHAGHSPSPALIPTQLLFTYRA